MTTHALLFYLLTCLTLHALGSDIIKGQNVPEGMMGYMASVQENGDHVCGGFLINERFVLTAAHCNEPNLSVVLGTHNLRKVNNNTMRYDVKMCPHHLYEDVSGGHDIMLLKLSRRVRLGKTVQIIHLPNAKMIKDKSKCRVAGWGLTTTGGNTSEQLKVVDVPIVSFKVCKEKWGDHLPTNVICAGGYGTKKGFCQGDSGGPLVCGGKAAGVVSFNNGSDCSYPNLPNVYTEVSKYLAWIKKILKQNNC